MLFFSTKNNEVIVDRPFQNSGVSVHQALVAFSARHSSRTEHRIGFSLIISIYKVVYISIKDLHVGYTATRWRNLLSNLLKKLNYITILKTAKMPPITLVNAWPS